MNDSNVLSTSVRERTGKPSIAKPMQPAKAEVRRTEGTSGRTSRATGNGHGSPPEVVDTPTASRWQPSLAIVLPLFGIGLALFSGGILRHPPEEASGAPWWSILLKEAGAVLMVVAVIHVIYELYIHRILHGDIRRLGVTVQTLQRTVSIVGGAIESGLAAVYSSREEANRAMTEQVGRMKSGSKVRILGISCGAFLCPHGSLHSAFKQLLEVSGVRVEALILDNSCPAAIERALVEDPHMFGKSADPEALRASYTVTRCHNELKTATDYAQDLADRCYVRDSKHSLSGISQNLAPTEPSVMANFAYKVYSTAPLCYLVVFEDCMFLESYHSAGRGGEAPMLKIARHSGDFPEETSLFRIYEKHFDKMWALSRDRAKEIHDKLCAA